MYLFFISSFIFLNASFASSAINLKAFNAYREKAQKQSASTESKLINYGDSYLNEHVQSSEKLSLAELLPMTQKEYLQFCKSYPKSVLKYYNLPNTKMLKEIKSPAFLEFDKLVKANCGKKK